MKKRFNEDITKIINENEENLIELQKKLILGLQNQLSGSMVGVDVAIGFENEKNKYSISSESTNIKNLVCAINESIQICQSQRNFHRHLLKKLNHIPDSA